MRFTIVSLLLFVAGCAIAFAAIVNANDTVAQALQLLAIVSTCSSLVIAFHASGRLQTFALTYGVFSFAMLSFRPIPSSLSNWVWTTLRRDAPGTTVAATVGELLKLFTVDDLLQLALGILISLLAAMFAAALRRSPTQELV